EEGEITYQDLPILIIDVNLEDSEGNLLTLDGDIGMNLFLPTHDTAGINLIGSAFDYLVFDERAKELRLTLVPEPAGIALLGMFSMLAFQRRRPAMHAPSRL